MQRLSFRLAVLSFGLICLAVQSLASAKVPIVLIVKVPPDNVGKLKPVDADPHNNLVQFVAQEFDDGGRVRSIAWDVTDPYFRGALDSGQLRVNPKGALLDDALRAGDKLKVDYVMTVCVWRDGAGVLAISSLYKNGKPIWRDPSPGDPTFQASVRNQRIAEENARKHKQQVKEASLINARQLMIGNTGDDQDNSLRSLAHTWAAMLVDGPLRNLPANPKPEPPKIDQGQKPPVVEVPAPPKIDNKQLLAGAMQMLAEHHNDQAIDALRDAVDAAPLDVERRRALINALAQTGQPLVAAQEARRAAALLPDQVELHILAAKAFLSAGQPDQAAADINEAVARDPNGPETRLLLGEVDLTNGKFADALSHFDFVVSKNATAQSYYDRALAKTLMGDGDGASKDLAAAKQSGLPIDPASEANRYSLIEKLFEKNEADLSPRSLSLIQRARVHPDDPAVASETDALSKKASAEVALLGMIDVPGTHKASCERRLLALKLLLQCYSDLADYIKAQNDDVISDATITVGEGLKDLDQAAKTYQEELQKG